MAVAGGTLIIIQPPDSICCWQLSRSGISICDAVIGLQTPLLDQYNTERKCAPSKSIVVSRDFVETLLLMLLYPFWWLQD